MNQVVSHILEDTDRSLPALVNPPEITHDISIGRLSVLKYSTLYMFHVHLEGYMTVFQSQTSFPGVQRGTAYFTQEIIPFCLQLNTSTVASLYGALKLAKGY